MSRPVGKRHRFKATDRLNEHGHRLRECACGLLTSCAPSGGPRGGGHETESRDGGATWTKRAAATPCPGRKELSW